MKPFDYLVIFLFFFFGTLHWLLVMLVRALDKILFPVLMFILVTVDTALGEYQWYRIRSKDKWVRYYIPQLDTYMWRRYLDHFDGKGFHRDVEVGPPTIEDWREGDMIKE